MSSVVLISFLLYQSAAFVFLDGSQVSEGLVMVSLAFHLLVVGTVIFALCSDDCSCPLLCCRQSYLSTHTVYQYKIQYFHYFGGIWPYWKMDTGKHNFREILLLF